MDTRSIKYTVSIRLMTYMHADYIKQAMDSIMDQKTNFLVEVVVGDDFSTDSTLDIIKSYHNTNNIHIHILDRKLNDEYWKKRQEKGRIYNFINILENCSGRYIVTLDGDDYWTDPTKLQKQVDFLEANPEYGLVYTNYRKINITDTIIDEKTLKKESNYYDNLSVNKLLCGNLIATCTVCFRKKILSKIDQYIQNFKMGDYPLWLEIAQESKIKFLNEITTSYRVTEKGLSNSTDKIKQFKFHKGIVDIVQYYLLKFDVSAEESENIMLIHSKRMIKNGATFKNKLMVEYGYVLLKQLNSKEISLYYYILYLGRYNGFWNLTKYIGRFLSKIKIVK